MASRARQLALRRETAADQSLKHGQAVEPLLKFHPGHVSGRVHVVRNQLEVSLLLPGKTVDTGVVRQERAQRTHTIRGRLGEEGPA